MRKFYIYMALASLLFGFGSCSKGVIEAELLPVAHHQIVINAFIKEGSSVRPISKAVGGDLASGFALGACWTPVAFDPGFSVAKTEFLTMAPYAKKPAFWNADGTTHHSFYAYSLNPASTAAGRGVISVNYSLPAFKTLSFLQPSEPNEMVDLLVAQSLGHVVNTAAQSSVNLYFEHRLSRVRFLVYGNGVANLQDCQASITYGNGALKSGAELALFKPYTLNVPLVNFHGGTVNLGAKFNITTSNINGATAADVGDLILIPQNAVAGWAVLKIDYLVAGNTVPKSATVEMPAVNLEQGKQYDVNIYLSEHTQVLGISNVLMTVWNTESVIVDQL